jgi:hypothetical protein
MTEREWLAVADYHRVAHLMTERTKRLYAVGCARLTPRPFPLGLLDAVADAVERAADDPAQEGPVAALHRDAAAAVAACQARPEGWWSPHHYLALAAERLASATGQEFARTVPGFLVEALGGKPHESYPPGDPRGQARRLHAAVLRDVLYNPYRDIRGRRLRAPRRLRRPPEILKPNWRTADVIGLATGIYNERAFDRLPILADALQDAECDNEDILNHCRAPGVHVRGCWVVDLVLGKE